MGNAGSHFCNDQRLLGSVVLGSLLCEGRQHIVRGLLRVAAFLLRLMVVAQAALVASQALLQPLGSAIEGGIGVVRLTMAQDRESTSRMYGNVGEDEMPLAAEHHMRLDRPIKIFPDDRRRLRF